MAKEFNFKSFPVFLQKTVLLEIKNNAIPKVSKEFKKDTDKYSFVPWLTGATSRSADTDSDFKKGQIKWTTDYVEKIYQSNRSGVPHWDTANWAVREKKYDSMIEDEIIKVTKKYNFKTIK